MMEIAVCIATYSRPDGLRNLLRSLVVQEGFEGRFGIIVIDNDPDGSARPVVDEFPSVNPELIYEIEPEPGIPAARNRGIALARSRGAATVAFIDDDESATPYWLATMYNRIDISGAGAVSGPVEPIFPADAPAWALRSRLFHRSIYPDGASLEYASTANSMLRLSAIAGNLQPFNPDFQFTGGSDTYLYQSLRRSGHNIIWEPAGLVYEQVPRRRISMRWLASRSYRHGITLARCDRLLLGTRRRLITRFARGLLQVPLGFTECVLGIAQKNDRWRRGVVRIARGAGVIAGLMGRTYDEYRREIVVEESDDRTSPI